MVTANDMGTIAAIQQRAKSAQSGGSGAITDQNAAPRGPADSPLLETGLAPGSTDLINTPATKAGAAEPTTQEKLNRVASLFQNYRGMA